MARSVAFYLTRFDEGPKTVHVERSEPIIEPEVEDIPETAPEIDISDEMRAQLIDEGRAAAKAEYDELIERERAAFAARLEGERGRWANEEGGRLGEQFHAALNDFASRLGEDVERILEPFVVREIREQMLVGLLERLRLLLADRENPVVHLSGPTDLLEAVSSKLNGEGIATRVEEIGGVDVKARLDSTSIETRLGEWIEQLRDGDDA